MDKKQVTNFRRRIIKARGSLNVMGDMLLEMDIDNMDADTRSALQTALLQSSRPVSYPYLDAAVDRDMQDWLLRLVR